MEYISIQKNVGVTPRKLRLVADTVRGLGPQEALEVLKFTYKTAAKPLSKAIQTALANSNYSKNLVFKKLEINEGPRLKRFRPGTKGRVRPYKKRLSHIKIVLTNDIVTQKPSLSGIQTKVKQLKNSKEVVKNKINIEADNKKKEKEDNKQ